MTDLISRQAAIEAVHKSIFDFFDICDDDEESSMTYKNELLLELNKAITTQIKAVASAQPIEAEPIKHGRWNRVVHSNNSITHYCSECGSIFNKGCADLGEYNYCPNCGARMDAQIGEDKSHPFAESVIMGMDGGENG